jgi:HlyD family secretion protein
LDVTNAQANLDVALANLDKAKKDHEKILKGPDPEDLAAAEARVDAVQATLDSAFITAPFDGTVTMAAPKSGDQVAAGTQAFRVDDLSRLLVDVEVSEIDINRIEVGQEVTLNFDAILDKDYKGEVVEVSPVGTEFQGIVNFQVTVELLDFDERVKPGMTAGLNIVVSQLDNVLLVLNRAVRVENGKRVVYVLNGQIPQSVEIELGASSDTYSEVIGGDLKPGDKIVLNPPVDFFGGGPPGGGGGGGFQP